LFELCHDGSRITEVLVVYEREADRINFETSKIVDIVVDPRFSYAQPHELHKDKGQMRWRTWIRIPLNAELNTTVIPARPTSWAAAMQEMKPSSSGTAERTEQRYFATFGCRSCVVNDAGEPASLSGDYPVCVKSVTWIEPDPTSQVTAPTRLVLTPDAILSVHTNDLHVASIRTGDFLQSYQSDHTMRLLTPGTGDHLGLKRRGRIYLGLVDKKRKLTRLYWLREPHLDLEAFEAKQRAVIEQTLSATQQSDTGNPARKLNL
jgi:hypothetical protein